MTGKLPAALLLDLDGTLVETEPIWQEVQSRIVQSLGGSWSAQFNQQLIGVSLLEGSELIKQLTSSDLDATEIGKWVMRDMIAAVSKGTAAARPGAVHLFHLAEDLEIPTAVVTSSARNLARAALKSLGGVKPDVLVAGDEVHQSKPNPEGYLTAAEQLGAAIEDCVVIEDSPAGILAGIASGAHTIAVPNHAEITPGLAVRVLDSLTDIDEDYLRSL